MLKFMVLSAPRSASTWVANWLTTDQSLCLHDPLLEHAPETLDAIPCDRMLGIACTALPLFADFVNGHPARKLIIHRDLEAINQSLVTLGLSALGWIWKGALDNLKGLHVAYESLFDPAIAARIYEHLLQRPFDAARHEQLRAMHIDPSFERITVVPDRVRDFRRRVQAAYGEAIT